MGRRFREAGKEKPQPTLPVPFLAYSRESPEVLALMLLEIRTQVEDWLGESAACVQQQRDEQAARSSVAVEEGVDRLELGVGEQHASLTVNEYETLLMQP
mgnify:CR=1 FL=1